MKHKLGIILFLVGLFLAAQYIGLGILNRYINYEKSSIEEGVVEWKALPSVAGVPIERPQAEPSKAIIYILLAVFIGTLLMLFIIRVEKLILLKLWFFTAIFFCLYIAFSSIMQTKFSLALSFVVSLYRVLRPSFLVQNLSELFVYSGLAVIFVPILNVLWAVVLLVIISLYDMYAVWKSKHMIEMAKFQTKSGVFAGLLLPYKMPKFSGKGKQVKIRTALLGGGDVAFPLIFSGVVLKTFGLTNALVVPPFVAITLFGLLYFGKKDRFYPAMPFLGLGCLAGLLVAYLI